MFSPGSPDVRSSTDRRAHPRIASIRLPDARIRIPARPPVSLVDLSSGGALLELPFQVVPQSRLIVELHTSAERLVLPLHLLRCYIAKLENGLRYHAAGAFDQLITLPSDIAAGPSTSSAVEHLIGSLERLRRAGHETAHSHSRPFQELLALAVAGLRQGESLDVITLKLKSRLTQRYPSLTVAASQPLYRATLTSAEFFGLTFKSKSAFSADDRRFLRSSAQLISLMEDCDRRTRREVEAARVPEVSSLVVCSGAG
jgi:hypothetical protein